MSSSSSSSSSSSTGIGVLGLTFVVLLVFKLAGMAGASWGLASLSWFWVFSPLILGFGIFFVVLAVIAIVALIVNK